MLSQGVGELQPKITQGKSVLKHAKLWTFIEHNKKIQYILTMTAIPLSNLFKYKRESAKNTMKKYSMQNSSSEQSSLMAGPLA